MCKGSPNNSEGDASELSFSRKSGSYNSLSKSLNNDKFMTPFNNTTIKNSPAAAYSMFQGSKEKEFNTYRSSVIKPDLPGRVSFSNPHDPQLQSEDNDSSDYENLNTFSVPNSTLNNTQDISAPGPINPKDYTFMQKPASPREGLQKELSSLSLKKSVHFRSSANGEEVLAETFEYPKCPSENCSCSTRSSSSGSVQEAQSPKCYCNLPTCKYLVQKTSELSHAMETDTNKISLDLAEPEESQVIRDYKNAVGEQLENSVVKNILEETKPAADLDSFELPLYLSKYSNAGKNSEGIEKPNNLAEHKSLNSNLKTESQKKDFLKMENKLESPSKKSSSETVINNYLKVAASTASIIKKKENISKAETKKCPATVNNSLAQPKTKAPSIPPLTLNNIKKAKREDSNLHEFNIDKIDTWISMHEEASHATSVKSAPPKHSVLEETFEKFTQETLEAMSGMGTEENNEDQEDGKNSEKSLDQSQDDSTYDEIVSVIKEIEEDKKKGIRFLCLCMHRFLHFSFRFSL